jgi:antitoxin component YwqK of YwqJK toxin-antitoxin module
MKKWMAFFLAMVMALSLWACGKDDTKAAPTEAPTTPTEAPTAPVENNGGENINQDPETGNFSLLTDMTIRYGEGDDAEIIKMEFAYDDDHDIVAYKAYLDGNLYSKGTFDKDTYNTLQQKDYTEDGVIDGTYDYTYDENGREIQAVTTDGEGNILSFRANTYTAQGLLEYSFSSFADEIGNYTTYEQYTYDDHGNILRYISGSGDEIWTIIVFENIYDGDRLSEVKTYEDGILQWCEQYDADGNLVTELSYGSEGEVFSREEWTYENGKPVRRVITNDGVESYREEYTYNADGQLVELRAFDEGEYHGGEVYTYENGDLVNLKLYEHETLEGEYTLNYRKVTVSEEQAQKLAALYATMMED